jgi:hypothetical protein
MSDNKIFSIESYVVNTIPMLQKKYFIEDLENMYFEITVEGKKYYVVYPHNTRDGSKIYFIVMNHNLYSIRKFFIMDGRCCVIIHCSKESTNEINSFCCYSSISDGGFWRLLLLRDDGGFDKGFDYATTTMINMNLQRLIHKTKSLYTIDNDPSYKYDVPRLKNLIDVLKISHHDLSNMINHRINEGTFALTNIFFKKMYKYFKHVKYLRNFKESIMELIDSLNQEISENNEEGIKLDSLIYCELNKNDLNIINNIVPGNRRNFFVKCRLIFEKCFLQYFIVDKTTNTHLFTHTTTIDTTTLTINTYQVIIRFKPNNQEYIMYHIRYKRIPSMTHNYNHSIINIIPINSKVSLFGLDSKYCACGAFINKIFDYKEQSPVTRLSSDPHETYDFIGEFTDYNFLKEIHH